MCSEALRWGSTKEFKLPWTQLGWEKRSAAVLQVLARSHPSRSVVSSCFLFSSLNYLAELLIVSFRFFFSSSLKDAIILLQFILLFSDEGSLEWPELFDNRDARGFSEILLMFFSGFIFLNQSFSLVKGKRTGPRHFASDEFAEDGGSDSGGNDL